MKLGKLRNVVFVVIASLFLLGPLASRAALAVGVSFPEWTGIGIERSNLEGRNYAQAPEFKTESILSGQFQTQLDKRLSDLAPMHDYAMLANAAWQRMLIALANSPKGYSCYPTYYGSTKLDVPEYNAVTYLPIREDDSRMASASLALSHLAELAASYPQTHFVIYVVQGGQFPAINPAYGYCSNITTGDEYVQSLLDSISEDTRNVSLCTSSYSSADGYFADFFRTDHHWNSQGAVAAFNQIAESIGIGRLENPDKQEFGGYKYSGATARWGLDLREEEVFDLGPNGESIAIADSDGNRKPYTHDAWNNDSSAFRRYRFHDEYYDWLPSESTLQNDSGQGSALVICDSYGADIAPMLAEQLNEVYYSKDLHSSAKTDSSTKLKNRLETTAYDYVILIAGCNNFTNLTKRSPDYFSL